jgi:hypothetical protein
MTCQDGRTLGGRGVELRHRGAEEEKRIRAADGKIGESKDRE